MLPFAFSRAERFNNFYKLLVVIVIKNKQIILKKKTNKQNYVKTSEYFYQKLYHLFFKCR